jgi:hypothetical protein
MRNVPGHKTDVKDAEWIADLVRHGLVAKSFVPPRPLRELRELLRYRRKLTESQAAERTKLQRNTPAQTGSLLRINYQSMRYRYETSRKPRKCRRN